MALIKCPECGNQVSTFASACPQCGCPVEAEKAEPAKPAAPAAPKPEADTIVVECPPPPPNGTCPTLTMKAGHNNDLANLEWGKEISVKLPAPVRVGIYNKAALKKGMRCWGIAIGCAVPGVLFLMCGALAAGESELIPIGGFIVGIAYILVCVGSVLTGVQNFPCAFWAAPGKRYKLFWEKRLTGHRLMAVEVPD